MASADPSNGKAADPSTAETEPDPDSSPDAAAQTTAAPLNRAERRAAQRAGRSSQQPTGKGKVGRQKGPVQTPRMWANRRSG
jgi:hypothetical protein